MLAEPHPRHRLDRGPERPESHRLNLVQGEARASADPELVMTTLLGSCVSACIWDPQTRVGGMNHFLLPGESCSSRRQESYGFYLMELLVNELMKLGARRDRLKAKLFGGAQTVDGLADIGARNAECARVFIENEGIALVSCSVGGHSGRRVEFMPASGRARQRLVQRPKEVAPELAAAKAPTPAGQGGEIELF